MTQESEMTACETLAQKLNDAVLKPQERLWWEREYFDHCQVSGDQKPDLESHPQ